MKIVKKYFFAGAHASFSFFIFHFSLFSFHFSFDLLYLCSRKSLNVYR